MAHHLDWKYGRNKWQEYWEAKPEKSVAVYVIRNMLESFWFCFISKVDGHDELLLDRKRMATRSKEKGDLTAIYLLQSNNAEVLKKKVERRLAKNVEVSE